MHQILIAAAQSAERVQLMQALRDYFGTGITIHAAATGSEALELFHRYIPQAAILDISLPDSDGIQVARQLRKTNIPCALIFLTAESTHAQAREIISLQATDYLLKPFPIRQLLQALEQALYPAIQDDAGLLPEARLAATRESIEAYLLANYNHELSMQAVAKAMNYSEAYFCKLFKQCFQMNFSVWLNQFRIEKAKQMLLDTRLSIRDVSKACGYTDANYFSRVFKQLVGKTPSHYRMG